MKAKVTVPFKGCPDGTRYPKAFNVGDEVEGELAAAMVYAGYAESEENPDKEVDPSATKQNEGANKEPSETEQPESEKNEQAEKATTPPKNKAKKPARNK
jgi:hypothetical protein